MAFRPSYLAGNGLTCLPEHASHTRAVPSVLTVTMLLSSGRNASAAIWLRCVGVVESTSLAVAGSHSRRQPSQCAVTSVLLSGENAKPLTTPLACLAVIWLFQSLSHKRIENSVLSAEARVRPSGE